MPADGLTAPPLEVLAAFGAMDATVSRLPGGQGQSWLATPPAPPVSTWPSNQQLVLKPVTTDEEAEEVTWLAKALAPLSRLGAEQVGLRLPVYASARAPDHAERWVVDGWQASTWVPGVAGPVGRWSELLAVAQTFTAAVVHLPAPDFLQRRRHPWAVADRAAWDEEVATVHRDQGALVARLRELAQQGPLMAGTAQLIHGDLTGNVLFSPGVPPSVIDVSPYWRPAAYAGAVIVADGLLWWGQGSDLIAEFERRAPIGLVARAVLFRLLTDVELRRRTGEAAALPEAEAPRYQRATDLLEAVVN